MYWVNDAGVGYRGTWQTPYSIYTVPERKDILIAPAEGFGQGFICPLGKKDLIVLVRLIFGNFWCPVITLVTFSSNLGNFERGKEI